MPMSWLTSMPMRLRGLTPLGPIFGKELKVAARRKRNHLLRVAYLGALLLLLLFAYAVTLDSGYGRSGAAMQAQQRAELSMVFFTTFAIFSVASMIVIGPVLTSTAIGGERLHRTLPVLLMTPITSWQIVSGKLLSRLLIALLLIGLTLPVLSLVRLLGGVELEQIVGVLCLAVTAAMSSAALGLCISVMVKRAYGVILLSYATILLGHLFAPMMIAIWISESGRSFGSPTLWMTLLVASNPVFTTGMLATGELPRYAAQWGTCALTQLGLSAVLLLLSALLLRRLNRREASRESGAAISAAPSADGAPAARPPRTSRHVWDHPILWREWGRPLMPSLWQRIAGAAACVGLLVLSYALMGQANALAEEEPQIGYAILFMGMMILLACVVSGTAIAQEKESDTWTLLLVAPVSASAVVWGKVLGVLRKLSWPFALIAGHFLVFTIGGVLGWKLLALILWIMVTCTLPWVACGVYLSLRLKGVTVAVVLSILLPIIVQAGVPIVLAIIDELLRLPGDLAEIVLLYLPYYYLGEAIDSWSPQDSGFRDTIYMPFVGQSGVGFFLRCALSVGLAHLLSFVAVVWLTVASFDRLVGRARQTDPHPAAA
jgi:ABC-type transport system involved in multi-copper enzyme maturation permease subunit